MMIIRIIFLSILVFGSLPSVAQCDKCEIEIRDNTVASYTVTSNHAICILPGVNYTGTITLNGGTICNKGQLSNVVFLNGTLNNYSAFISKGNLVVNNNGDVIINNYSGSKVLIDGNCDIQSSQVFNSFNVNILNGPSAFMISGNLNCLKGSLAFNPKTDSKQFGEGVFVNIGGQFNIGSSSSLLLNILQGASFNVNNAVTFDGKYNKTIANQGNLNFNNDFNIGGKGQNIGVVSISNFNKGIFNIIKNISSSYSNGTVTINNSSLLKIGGSYTQSKDVSILNNTQNVDIGTDLNVDRGSVTNYGNISARNYNTKLGTFTNYRSIRANNDFSVTTNTAVINNNGLLDINGSFSNKGIINLGTNSLINTNNYINKDDGVINGPNNTYDSVQSKNDTSLYAKILIYNNSTNSGFINGNIIVYDQSLTSNSSNINFGFDQVTNANRIASSVLYATAGTLPGNGNPPIRHCNLNRMLYTLQLSANDLSICPGQCTTLSSHFSQIYNLGMWGNWLVEIPLSSYIWQPGNISGQFISVCPHSDQVYSMSVVYQGCVFTSQISISVANSLVVSVPNNIMYVNPGTSYQIVPTINGGTPVYNCAWSSSISGPIPSLCALTIVPNLSQSYNLTVTDSKGCTASTQVVAKILNNQYAELKDQLDGTYHLVKNNKFYFKYIGQYIGTSLNYKLFDSNRNQVNCANLIQSVGDNRFVIDFSVCSNSASGFYTLEVLNEKNEKQFLKMFK